MKILLPLDGSKFSEAIIKAASELARSTGAEVHLISVVKGSDVHSSWYQRPGSDAPHSAGQVPIRPSVVSERLAGLPAETRFQAEESIIQQATDYLDDIAAQSFPAGAQTKAILGEDVAAEIRGYALRERVDLIALATHGRTGVSRLVMGSIANDLLHSGEVPLLLVRPQSLN